MKCSKCGAELLPNALFCRECGRTVEDGQPINEDELNEIIEELVSNCQGS